MRDDFSQKTKEILSKRAQGKCSNPECRQPTSKVHSEEDKVINIGVAAHITAASPGFCRYDPTMTSHERSSISNGIWLCQSCAKLIDSDSPKYAVEKLRAWKIIAERGDEREAARMAVFSKIERMMPELLEEMRQDLAKYPLKREFVLLRKSWTYNDINYLAYYYDVHDDLDDKMTILSNHGLIVNATYNNTTRYKFTETFVDYLTQK
jgi:hypothetical protein